MFQKIIWFGQKRRSVKNRVWKKDQYQEGETAFVLREMSPFWRHCRRRLEIKVVALPDHFLVPILDQESNYLVWLGKWRREKFVTDWAKPLQIFLNYPQLCCMKARRISEERTKKMAKRKWVVLKIVVSLNFWFPLAFLKKSQSFSGIVVILEKWSHFSH